MSSDPNVTVVKVITLAVAHGMSSACRKIKATVTTQLTDELVNTLLEDLKVHFDSSESNMIVATATFPDPRFKNVFHNQQTTYCGSRKR